MISSISSGSSSMMQPPQISSASLTDEQQETLSSILSNYDSENASEDELESLMSEIKDAGIPACEDLFSALDEAGFEKPEKGGTPPPPPPEGTQGAASGLFADLTSQLESGEITEDEFQSALASIQAQSETSEGNIVDTFA